MGHQTIPTLIRQLLYTNEDIPLEEEHCSALHVLPMEHDHYPADPSLHFDTSNHICLFYHLPGICGFVHPLLIRLH